MMLLPHTVRASTLSILMDIAVSRALRMYIRISAARKMTTPFIIISRTSTGVLSFTRCVLPRYTSRLQAEFCLHTSPAQPIDSSKSIIIFVINNNWNIIVQSKNICLIQASTIHYSIRIIICMQ